jgi:hypothetical protein
MGKRRYDSTILKPGTKWRQVVSFTALLLYPHKDSPRYALDRTLGGPQIRSGRYEKKNP